eukprot:3932770-Rhodomonas_salina.2
MSGFARRMSRPSSTDLLSDVDRARATSGQVAVASYQWRRKSHIDQSTDVGNRHVVLRGQGARWVPGQCNDPHRAIHVAWGGEGGRLRHLIVACPLPGGSQRELARVTRYALAHRRCCEPIPLVHWVIFKKQSAIILRVPYLSCASHPIQPERIRGENRCESPRLRPHRPASALP